MNITYLYLLSPLHTGGASQEGNLVGIARESHTELPYAPSSTIRGRLRSLSPDLWTRLILFGPDLNDLGRPSQEKLDQAQKDWENEQDASIQGNLQKNWMRLDELEQFHKEYKKTFGKDLTQLEQGNIWIGDASLLWIPVPSLSHSVIWISCPALLKRWKDRTGQSNLSLPKPYQAYLGDNDIQGPVYLKDSILKTVQEWEDWQTFVPTLKPEDSTIQRVLVLPDQHCSSLIQMSLWRQVKVKLDEHKTVDGGFRYEEAIPPDTLMYFPWGLTNQAKQTGNKIQKFNLEQDALQKFRTLLNQQSILQIGGQESLGRGFVEHWVGEDASQAVEPDKLSNTSEGEHGQVDSSQGDTSSSITQKPDSNETDEAESKQKQLINFDSGKLGKAVYRTLVELRQPYQTLLDDEKLTREEFDKHIKEQKGQAVELYSYLSTWGLMRLKAEEFALNKWKYNKVPADDYRERARKNQEGKREVVAGYFKCLSRMVEKAELAQKGGLDALLQENTANYLGLAGLGLAIAQEFSFWATVVYSDITGEE